MFNFLLWLLNGVTYINHINHIQRPSLKALGKSSCEGCSFRSHLIYNDVFYSWSVQSQFKQNASIHVLSIKC